MSGQLERLLAQATPGPWEFDAQTSGRRYGGIEYLTPMVEGPLTRKGDTASRAIVHEYVPVAPQSECIDNARLIALAPTLARLLVDAMAALDKGQRFERFYQETLGATPTAPQFEILDNLQSAFLDAYTDVLARFAEVEQQAGEGQG